MSPATKPHLFFLATKKIAAVPVTAIPICEIIFNIFPPILSLSVLIKQMKHLTNSDIIYKILQCIPQGKVLTYQSLAGLFGIKNPRVVGNILHRNNDPESFPCHRVVNVKGELAPNYAFGGSSSQKEKLIKEKVIFVNEKVDLHNALWLPSEAFKMYLQLLIKYGEPGPWPWFDQDSPHSSDEIVIGALLTQNTNWRNVSYAIKNLRDKKICSLRDIYKLKNNIDILKSLIRPSGFYNQKAERLILLCDLIFEKHKGLDIFIKLDSNYLREELLNLKGIGKETADTIVLYAAGKPIFVTDAYTKKFVQKYFKITKNDYDSVQNYFMKNLPKNVQLYQDYHALIVQWAKDKAN